MTTAERTINKTKDKTASFDTSWHLDILKKRESSKSKKYISQKAFREYVNSI